MYILFPTAFVPKTPRKDLSEGQELVLTLPLPDEEGMQGSPGEGDEAARLCLRVQGRAEQLRGKMWSQTCPQQPLPGLEKEGSETLAPRAEDVRAPSSEACWLGWGKDPLLCPQLGISKVLGHGVWKSWVGGQQATLTHICVF